METDHESKNPRGEDLENLGPPKESEADADNSAAAAQE